MNTLELADTISLSLFDKVFMECWSYQQQYVTKQIRRVYYGK